MAGYEVFISFKNTDAQNRPTKDSQMAESLYYAFKNRGIRAFYSNISIQESGESSYRKAIDRALGESRVMVVVGTKYEYVAAPQVDAEIEQFRNDMLNGVKPLGKSRLFTYLSGITINQLPDGLRQYQSCFSEQDVLNRVCNFLNDGSGFQNMGETEVLYQGSADQPVPVLTKAPQKKEPCMEPGTIIDGRYKILNLIGRGGMSYVHLAYDQKFKRSVAVKEFRSHDAMSFDVVTQGLIAEIGLMKKLSHPAIPRIHDVIDFGDSFIFVMDFVEGTSLNQILSEEGVLKEGSVIDIGRQLADVLDYLHTRPAPVIYRDLKPANVIMKPDGKVMLIDFGIAREYKEKNLADTTCLGTVGYAAPEQFGGMGQTDTRTDIYNLGVTLYHLVTGRNPAQPPYEILPIRLVDKNLSYGLEYIIQTCTEKDPNKRFQSARELLDAFDNINKLGSRAQRKAVMQNVSAKIAGAIPLTDKWLEKKRGEKKQDEPQLFAVPGTSARRPVAPPGQLQPLPRIESAMETTVLSQIQPVPVPPLPNTVLPKPVPVPIPPKKTVPDDIQDTPDFYSAPTEPLDNTHVLFPVPVPPVKEEPPAPEAPKPKTRKVIVRSKAPSNPELNDMVAKLSAMDPESRKLVAQLIDQLSK